MDQNKNKEGRERYRKQRAIQYQTLVYAFLTQTLTNTNPSKHFSFSNNKARLDGEDNSGCDE